jgi:hypothetical protein
MNIVIQDRSGYDFTLSSRRALDLNFYATKLQIKNAISAARKAGGDGEDVLTIKPIEKPRDPGIKISVSVRGLHGRDMIELGCHRFMGEDLRKLRAWLRRP